MSEDRKKHDKTISLNGGENFITTDADSMGVLCKHMC